MDLTTICRALALAFGLAAFSAGAAAQDEGVPHEQDLRNYLSTRAGASIHSSSHPGEEGFEVGNLIDGGTGPEGVWRVHLDPQKPVRPWVIVELPKASTLTTFAINTGHLFEDEYRGTTVRQVNIAISDTPVQSAFKTVARFNLRKRQDNQVVTIESSKARYVRFMLMGNWNNPEWVEMGRVYGYNDVIYSEYNALLYTEGKVEVTDVLFETGSAELLPGGLASVMQMGAVIQDHPDWQFQIEGHTDNQGNPASNKALSRQRANAVVEALVGLGIDRSRLKAVGFGSAKPVAPNDTEEGRAKNRRVTFRVLRDSSD